MISETRETLDRRIRMHLDDILVLGSMVEQAILGSVQTLIERDLDQARKIYANDQAINNKRHDIERTALITVATQQPMARDNRLLASVLDIAGELERMGDYAKGIARITIRLGNEMPLPQFEEIPKMAEITSDMLHRALGAFVEGDQQAASLIPDEDDRVDKLYNDLYRKLLDIMFHDKNAIDRATFYLWVSHNLERTADRVTNICERTIFTVTGELYEIDQSDDEAGEF
jgi:phosphate transport system protein